MVVVHLGNEPTEIEWPTVLSKHRVLQSAHFEKGEFTVQETSRSPRIIQAEPRSIHRWLLSGRPERSQALQPWKFEITADSLCSGSTLSVVGAGPEMGNWDPAKGIELNGNELGIWSATTAVPTQQVYAWHLVVQSSTGTAIWEPGMDRYTLVGPTNHESEVKPHLSTARWTGEVVVLKIY